MSYLLTFLVCILLVFGITVPLNAFADGQPVINEFLPHPSDGNKEWVELYIPDGTNVDGYWIDDDTDFSSDTGNSAKKQITSVIQGSDSQHVVFELSSSMFNNDGDTIALFSPDGTLLDSYSYSKDPGVDVAIGRTPDALGSFQVLASATKGSPNSQPQPTPTPTSEPTDKPTKEPKPTETPVPTKSKTQSSVSTPTTDNQSILADEISNASTDDDNHYDAVVSTDEAIPTSILRNAITGAPNKNKTASHKRILIKGTSSSVPQIITVMIGGLLLLSCGILMYLKKKGIWIWKRDS